MCKHQFNTTGLPVKSLLAACLLLFLLVLGNSHPGSVPLPSLSSLPRWSRASLFIPTAASISQEFPWNIKLLCASWANGNMGSPGTEDGGSHAPIHLQVSVPLG